MILVNNRELIIPNNERQLGTTYDSRTTNRTFSVKRDCTDGVDLANLDFRLDLKYRENRTIYSLTKATTITNGSLHVNKFVFLDKESTAGTYVFTYDGTDWTYDSEDVELEEYGITIKAGTPVSGNTITITLTTSTSDLDTLELDKSVSEDTIILNWLVTNSQLLVPGVVYVQMRAMNGTDVKWSSYEGTFFVESHINVPGSYGDLSELEQLEQDFKSLEKETGDNVVQAEKWATGKHNNVPVTSDEPQYNNNAKYYSDSASASATSADSAKNDAVTAKNAAVSAKEDAVDAKDDAVTAKTQAQGYASDASDYADNASDSATSASGSATSASSSATSASGYKEDAEAWAWGKRDGQDIPSTDPAYHKNAKYWADTAQQIVGEGIMQKTTYDTHNKSQDIFDYADGVVSTHNSSASAHSAQFAEKVDKVAGKGLSRNDFTDSYKTKLDGIAPGAEVNVQSDWTESDNSADDYIKNKPVALSDFIDNLGNNPTHTHPMVRYDQAQSLSDAQKAQARENIGASAGAVLYNESQNLTTSEKAQARTNIGAISQDQAIYISDSQPSSTDVKAWIDTSVGMVIDAGFVFGNVWDIALDADDWTLSSGKYTQTVSALALDHHFVLLGWIDNPTDSQADAYSLIEDIKSDSDGYVTVVCSSQPSVDFTIKVKYHESTEQKTFDDIARSNPNLLDNGWFTVNQRGVSSWGTYQYGVDRWISHDVALTVNSDKTISVPTNGIIYQRNENSDAILGKTITASVMLSNGIIYSGTVNIPSSRSSSDQTIHVISNDNFTYDILLKTTEASNDNQFCIITSNSSITIKAVKLELGSISTLYIDSAPSYAEELLKCQRYFVKVKNAMMILANGLQGQSLFSSSFSIFEMRANPVLTFDTDSSGNVGIIHGVAYVASANLTVSLAYKNNFGVAIINSIPSSYYGKVLELLSVNVSADL